MDHSIMGYLQRRTTEELQGILHAYLYQKTEEVYTPTVCSAVEILKLRYDVLPAALACDIAQFEAILAAGRTTLP